MDSQKPMLASALKLSGSYDTDTYGAWTPTNPHRHKAPTAQAPRCSTQRAGITRPHAEGDGLSGVTSDRELNAFNSVPASFVGSVPLTRAMNRTVGCCGKD